MVAPGANGRASHPKQETPGTIHLGLVMVQDAGTGLLGVSSFHSTFLSLNHCSSSQKGLFIKLLAWQAMPRPTGLGITQGTNAGLYPTGQLLPLAQLHCTGASLASEGAFTVAHDPLANWGVWLLQWAISLDFPNSGTFPPPCALHHRMANHSPDTHELNQPPTPGILPTSRLGEPKHRAGTFPEVPRGKYNPRSLIPVFGASSTERWGDGAGSALAWPRCTMAPCCCLPQ